jgi:2-keto-4-pentenoate hydratase/2-oxohepta-3-ene-1,7-dioic acid hydratase in catechol pathway
MTELGIGLIGCGRWPGDAISTGTPEGISETFDRDVVECCVQGTGVLRNPVVMIPD